MVLFSNLLKRRRPAMTYNSHLKVVNDNGEQFELRVDGYMLDYKPDNYFDNNWLRGEIVLSNKRVKERVSLQFLLVEELIQLKEWISMIDNSYKSTNIIFDCIDPNMRFRVWKRKPVKTIRFIYHSEHKEIYTWEMILNEMNVTSLKCQLDEILLKYPIR